MSDICLDNLSWLLSSQSWNSEKRRRDVFNSEIWINIDKQVRIDK